MDDQKFSGLLSQLIPDEIENRLSPGGENEGEQNIRMVELLKSAAGQAGGGTENEINEFLNGRGALLETTRSAVARGGKTAAGKKAAEKVVADFLTKQLHLSAPLAKLFAPLIVQLFPAVGTLAGTSTAAKPKPRRKKKKKEESSAKPRKPKPSSSSKPSASGKPKKPKGSSSGKPRKPKPSSSSQAGRKRPKRSLEIDASQEA